MRGTAAISVRGVDRTVLGSAFALAALALTGALVLLALTVAPTGAHAPAGAVGGTPIVERAGKQAMIAARQHFFGRPNVNPETGAVRRDRVILSWFGVSQYAMAINGHVVLLGAWVPRGQHTGYVPTSPQELAALKPERILVGHAHFDHAADVVPIAQASGATIVATAEHCADFLDRDPLDPPSCVSAIPPDAPQGFSRRMNLIAGVGTTLVKHRHSEVTQPSGADGGYHAPVLPFPSETIVDNPPSLEDMFDTIGHLPEAEGGSLLWRFRIGSLSLVWHDTSGPIGERAPEVVELLRRFRPVDVELGAIQGFNQYTNGMRDPLTYIRSLRPSIFVPGHHDDWALPGITAQGSRYEPYFDAALERIRPRLRPSVRFLVDPFDYVRPRLLTFRLDRFRAP